VTPRCYLDWNASSPVRQEVVAAVVEVLQASLGNPSSVHAEGARARRLVEQARTEVAAFLGASPDEIVFTSGGTESNAMALWGLCAAAGGPGGRPLLVSASEHPAVLAMADEMARFGAAVERIPVGPSGLVNLAALADALVRLPGAAVAVQLANSETGVLQELEAVCNLAHAAGGDVHCDAVQGAGKVPLPPGRWGVDTMAVSGHKLGSPSGTGAMVVKAGVVLAPLVPGTQERHRRGGTENVAGIVGLGVACRLAASELPRWQELGRIRDAFESAFLEDFREGVVYGAAAPRLPNTSCVGLPPGLRGGAAVAALDLEGLAVSSGPACSSGVERRNSVVEAMGFGEEASERTLRVSLGPGTSAEEVLGLVAAIERIWCRGKGGVR